MEDFENPIPVPPIRPLRLMRFSFEPNSALVKAMGLFVQESKRPTTQMRFFASRQLLIQIPNYFAEEGSLQRIGRKFTAFNEPIHVAPSIRRHEMKNLTTRFQLRTTNQDAFDELTSLDVSPDNRFVSQNVYAPQGHISNELEKQPTFGNYLFIDLASDSLVKANERKIAEHSFVTKASADNFSLHTIGLIVMRDILPRSESTNTD